MKEIKNIVYPKIYENLVDMYDTETAEIQTDKMTNSLIKSLLFLQEKISKDEFDNLYTKFHDLKTTFLYADMYYESDLSSQLEDLSKKNTKDKENIKTLYEKLIYILTEEE